MPAVRKRKSTTRRTSRSSSVRTRGLAAVRWLSSSPKRLVYGSLFSIVGIGLLSIPFIATSNAVTTSTSGTSTTAPSRTTTAGATTTPATKKISCNQAGIQKLVNSVSQTKIKANLQELVQDNTKPKPNALISRHVSSPGNKIKTNWAKGKLKSYGLKNINQRVKQGKYTVDNVIGRLEGSTPNVLYAAGGHIDSINGDSNDNSKPAPGGNDDGSGTVAAMEAGRVMKAFQPCMKASIDFIGFNYEETAEEWGSDYYVKQIKGKKTFKGLYNMDMIGYAPKTPCMYSYYNQSGRDKPMASLLKTVNTKYKIGLTFKVASYDDEGHDIDSSNFWEEGLPSAYLYQCDDDDPGYHKPSDTLKNINYVQITKTTKAVVAALAELSMK